MLRSIGILVLLSALVALLPCPVAAGPGGPLEWGGDHDIPQIWIDTSCYGEVEMWTDGDAGDCLYDWTGYESEVLLDGNSLWRELAEAGDWSTLMVQVWFWLQGF
ncbi:MAG: hypothetical protein KAW17_12290 [Candidatus Eisenbacteria sp.]|nr:hypothetical protein [Candidatus Eisenbacteria bacterium]